MKDAVGLHYGGSVDLASRIEDALRSAGKDTAQLESADLAGVDEFHIRGRKATLELAARMELGEASHVLDIGSGLGGPARTLAETYGCQVTGLDLTASFCEAAEVISQWVGLAERVFFHQGDAASLPFEDDSFDAAMTVHAAMNMPDKGAVYGEAKRVLRPGRVFAVYDVLQGEGGPVLFPVPWARDPSISHLATPPEMRRLLAGAGFELVDEIDSSEESLAWFEEMAARMKQSGPPALSFRTLFGDEFPLMAKNQIQNLADKRIRTVTYICKA